MDDYVVSNLNESKNEWAVRLVNILTPLIIEGFRAIFHEADRLCVSNDEEEKYLMTFQNLLANIPNWNTTTIDQETDRITEKSSCGYLTDLISCVHVIQLKILTCVRVGQNTKSVSIDIPSLPAFVHKVYINIARQLYSNIYLFEKDVPPLTTQKNNRELELITRECILNTVRENIPVENILKAYLAETDEEVENDTPEVKEAEGSAKNTQESTDRLPEGKEEPDGGDTSARTESGVASQTSPVQTAVSPIVEAEHTPVPVVPPAVPQPEQSLTFSDTDMAIDVERKIEPLHAPKDIAHLEQRSAEKAIEDDEEDDEERIEILGNNVALDVLDVNDLRENVTPAPPALSGVEILD